MAWTEIHFISISIRWILKIGAVNLDGSLVLLETMKPFFFFVTRKTRKWNYDDNNNILMAKAPSATVLLFWQNDFLFSTLAKHN